MDLQDMRFALCIARHQNLTKAARELYVSQPTLSKCLQKLEEEAHGKLFTRIDNRYCPTYLGEQYLNYARSALALERQWKQTVADVDALQEGELNIALPLMRSYSILPKVVTAFREKYPRFTLNIYEESTGVQEKLLLDSKIDFAIFNELFPNPNLQYDLLKKEEILLVLPPDHPLKSAGIPKKSCHYPWMDLSLFAREPFILYYPEQHTGSIALELFQQYQIEPPVVLRTRSSLNTLMLSQQGIGSCFMSESYVKAMPFENKPDCFSIGESGIFSTLYVAYRKGTVLSACARDFIELVKERS